jgi:hypothetical protein
MTPDNGAFATAAYVITAIVYLAYAASIKLRERRIHERLARLDASARPPSSQSVGA